MTVEEATAATTPDDVAVIGAGYVGLTTAACLASLGHCVTCVDIDETRIARLGAGQIDMVEARLADLVQEGLRTGCLRFQTDARQVVPDVQVVIVCVPTPMADDGTADTTAVDSVIKLARQDLPSQAVVVIKSTVPAGTAHRLRDLLGRPDVHIASNPEFLREGSAVADFLAPDRIVIGADQPHIAHRVATLYRKIDAPVLTTDTASAELTKYAANAFLAMKLSYVNTIAELCGHTGANPADVLSAMGHDHRIGSAFLHPGPGWGGPCLPKDTRALLHLAYETDSETSLLSATLNANDHQQQRVADKIRTAVGGNLTGRRVTLLGLAFKAGTADLRSSPALRVSQLLATEGAVITAYDPSVDSDHALAGVTVVGDPYEAARSADLVALLTDWPEFADLEWRLVAKAMTGNVVIDTRSMLSDTKLRTAGLALVTLTEPSSHRAPKPRESV